MGGCDKYVVTFARASLAAREQCSSVHVRVCDHPPVHKSCRDGLHKLIDMLVSNCAQLCPLHDTCQLLRTVLRGGMAALLLKRNY